MLTEHVILVSHCWKLYKELKEKFPLLRIDFCMQELSIVWLLEPRGRGENLISPNLTLSVEFKTCRIISVCWEGMAGTEHVIGKSGAWAEPGHVGPYNSLLTSPIDSL